jgi:hypothetical protein
VKPVKQLRQPIFNQPKLLGYREGGGANITFEHTQMHWVRAIMLTELQEIIQHQETILHNETSSHPAGIVAVISQRNTHCLLSIGIIARSGTYELSTNRGDSCPLCLRQLALSLRSS